MEKETARLEAFSDGVFAIAITLLILDIKVPRELPAGVSLLQALLKQWPSLIAFLTSFFTILIMWINHHRIFSQIKRVDDLFLLINGCLLLLVTFIPFPTSLVAEYITTGEQRTAVAIYCGTNLVMALIFNALWRYGLSGQRLLGHQSDPGVIQFISKGYAVGPGAYLGAFLLAFVNAYAAFGVCITLAVFFAWPNEVKPKTARKSAHKSTADA